MANTEVDGEKICPDALLFDRRLDLAIAYRAHLGGFVNRTASGRSYLLRPLLLPTDLPTSPAIMTVVVVLLRSLARGWETWMWCAAGYNGGGGLVASAAMVDDGVLPCWVSSLCGEEFLENPGSILTIDDSPWPAPVSLGANVGGPGTVKRTERKTLVANCPLIEPRSLMKKKLRTRLLVSNLEVPHRL
nr:hypothetical protein Iba_chr01eCG6780 [Ipomoea batatas]